MGSGGRAPRTPENFRKFQQSLNKIAKKRIILAYFSENFSKLCGKSLQVWTKNTICCEVLEKILKEFDENSIVKLNLYLIFDLLLRKKSLQK